MSMRDSNVLQQEESCISFTEQKIAASKAKTNVPQVFSYLVVSNLMVLEQGLTLQRHN